MDTHRNIMYVEDRIYPTDNLWEIPCLLLSPQPSAGYLANCTAWGHSNVRREVQLWHFYEDDKKFETLYKHPEKIINTFCLEIVEPNFSTFETMPMAEGVHQIYKKRWIARCCQEYKIKIYVDLNVATKFVEINLLGIPQGYNAFATRGYAERPQALEYEIDIARNVSGKQAPNMLVFGGGKEVERICHRAKICYIPLSVYKKGGSDE